MNYNDIKGNEIIIENLKSSVKDNRVSHSYVFDGGSGMGKTMLAKVFAKTLLCEKGGSQPCDECSSCRTFDSGTNPDVIYVTHEKKNITVENIRRQVLEQTVIKPFRYKKKVFIIDDADTMNVQAQNAMLKTLEEPAPYAVFLLLSENLNKFLSTVISRCIVFRLRKIPDRIIKQHLIQCCNASPTDAEYCCAFADGSIGRAVEYYRSDEFTDIRNFAIDLTEKLDSADMTKMYRLLADIEKYKDNILTLLDVMLITYRDALITAAGVENLVMQRDNPGLIKKLAKGGKYALIKACSAVEKAKADLNGYADFQLTMENLFFELKLEK